MQRANRARQRGLAGSTKLLLVLAVLLGILAGVGGYTFVYAEGLSYMSSDPKVCANCHIMQPQYDSWQKSSHHAVAGCVDCHLPHDFVGKYVAKARERLSPLEGLHAAGLRRADRDQADQQPHPAGELPGLPRRAGARQRCTAAGAARKCAACIATSPSATASAPAWADPVPDDGGCHEIADPSPTAQAQRGISTAVLLAIVVVVALAAAGVTALLMNIFERKQEAKVTYDAPGGGHRRTPPTRPSGA